MVWDEYYILYLWLHMFYLYNKHSFQTDCVPFSALLIQKHFFFPFLYSVEAIYCAMFLDKEKKWKQKYMENTDTSKHDFMPSKFVTRSCCVQVAVDIFPAIRHNVSVRS